MIILNKYKNPFNKVDRTRVTLYVDPQEVAAFHQIGNTSIFVEVPIQTEVWLKNGHSFCVSETPEEINELMKPIFPVSRCKPLPKL